MHFGLLQPACAQFIFISNHGDRVVRWTLLLAVFFIHADVGLFAHDFGDAPDAGPGTGAGNYQTLLSDGGPQHRIDPRVKIGIAVDDDSGDLHNRAANADDVDGALPDDEDGVLNPRDLRGTVGAAPSVTLLASNESDKPGRLAGWIDFDNDGRFESTERATINVPGQTTNGRFRLTFPQVPAGSSGTTWARFRLSVDPSFLKNPEPTGSAVTGEVEDYVFTIQDAGADSVGGFLKITHNLNGGPALQNGEVFGWSVASPGDLNGDGVADLAVGAGNVPTGGGSRGGIHVLMMNVDGTAAGVTTISHNLNGGPPLTANDGFGAALVSLGDVDGDGVNDLAAGAASNDTGGTERGAVYILLLNTDGSAKSFIRIAHEQNGGPTLSNADQFGISVAAPGDVDGDGVVDLVVDLVVGARRDGAETWLRGALYILRLRPDGTVKNFTRVVDEMNGRPGQGVARRFAESVTSLGDLDGDGVADLAVGDPFDDTRKGTTSGAVYILLMNADGRIRRSTKIGQRLNGGPMLGFADQFGSSVASPGDLDGDSVPDLVVGAEGDGAGSAAFRGAIHVVWLNVDGTAKGSAKIANNLNGGPPLTAAGRFGRSIASPGDLDGDGLPDLAAGSPYDSTDGPSRGAVWVLNLASATHDFGDAPAPYPTLLADDGPRHLAVGPMLGAGRDREGDGAPSAGADFDDVFGVTRDDDDGVLHPLDLQGTVGASPKVTLSSVNRSGTSGRLAGWIDYDHDGTFDDATERAVVNVLNNSGGRYTLSFPPIPPGSAGRTYARFRLSTDPDFVTAPSATGEAAGGEVEDYVFSITEPGNGTARQALKIAHELNGGPTLALSDRFGQSVAALGDLNGDGTADLAAGVILGNTDGPAGAVHVLLMNADGSVSRSVPIGHNLNGGPVLPAGDQQGFGRSVASAGDVDGNGVADLAVGAPFDDDGGTQGANRGSVYVILLNVDGSAKSATKIAHNRNGGPTLADGDRFGTSVASLGDLDGDGVADLAVGAEGDDSGGPDRGAVHLLLLNTDGSVKNTTRIRHNQQRGPKLADHDFFGRAVTSPGDLNDDGVADLAVGAHGDASSGAARGAVHVLLLSASGDVKSSARIAHDPGKGLDLDHGAQFGRSATSAGDLDGDGVNDLVAGAPSDSTGGIGRGAIYVLHLNSNGSLKRATKIAHGINGGPRLADTDEFGASVTSLGDLDGDGVVDLAVGAEADDTGNINSGAVWILNLTPL